MIVKRAGKTRCKIALPREFEMRSNADRIIRAFDRKKSMFSRIFVLFMMPWSPIDHGSDYARCANRVSADFAIGECRRSC